MKKRKIIVSSLFSLAVIFQIPQVTGVANAETNSDATTDRVLVEFDSAVLSTASNELKKGANQIKDDIYSLELPENEELDVYIDLLESTPGVKHVEPDYIQKLTYTPNDPYTNALQYHHKTIGTYDVWNQTKGSKNVKVAILDNGFDLYHSDLYDSNWESYYWTTTEFSIEDHGTHVAGIIAATMDNGIGGSGVSPGVSLLPIDVFEDEESAYHSDIIDGIYAAVELGADIINMSLGGYNYSYLYDQAIQYAYSQGVVIIASAGNEAVLDISYPAGYMNVISVASTDSANKRSNFSNYGFTVDISAPGSYIYSTLAFNRYGYSSGTSMAAPVVSGVAALIKSNEPHLTNDQIRNRLFETATDLGTSGYDIYHGFGLVNAAAAVKAVPKSIYTDFPLSHWAYDEVAYLANLSIINGYPNNIFKPLGHTTRAEAAKMLAVALDLDVKSERSRYKDVKEDHWAKDYITAATKAGIFNGNPDGTFKPNDKLTRAQMAKLLSAAYGFQATGNAHFYDVKVGHWANADIAAMFENNITVGYPDGSFKPNNPTNRAEFSVFLARALNEDFR